MLKTLENVIETTQHPNVVFQKGRYRIIECRHQLQWIIQIRRGERCGRARWKSESYCQTKTALLRLWRGYFADPYPMELVNLPNLITDRHK